MITIPGGELGKRVVSAIVLLVIVLWDVWVGGLAFALLCAVGALIVLYEYSTITVPAMPAQLPGLMMITGLLVCSAWFLVGPMAAVGTLCFGAIALAVAERRRAGVGLWAPGGLAYAMVPFLALALLRGDSVDGLTACLFVFACVWGADTLAYFTGRALGGPKLAPRISPGKTWSGFFGGLAGAVIVSGVAMVLLGEGYSVMTAVLAICLAVVATLGDLGESWIKRRFGRKDSGHSIPGHGGLMDRIDALIPASIAAWLAGGLAGGALFVPGSSGEALVGRLL